MPRSITAALNLDYDTMAGADRFGNLHISRLPPELSAQVPAWLQAGGPSREGRGRADRRDADSFSLISLGITRGNAGGAGVYIFHRSSPSITPQVEEDPTGGKFAGQSGVLGGASNKLDSIINFHVRHCV